MTRASEPDRRKASILKSAVEDNVDTIAGRLPDRTRGARLPVRGWSGRVALAMVLSALALSTAGVAHRTAPIQRAPAVKTTGASPATAPAPAGAETEASVLAQPVSPDVLALGVRRVIIDAGHGGDNLGTWADGGLLEKDLTLDIAERVRQLIAQHRFEAIMTRTSDEPVSLGERATTANQQRGDIFVSIHLNSFRPSHLCGVETYYLGPSNDPERNAIAARENEESGYSLSDLQVLLKRIYTDARRDESRRLAQTVQRALARTLQAIDPSFTDRGVKMAPFVVLVATEMPAVLAEVSCLSNPAEAERLRAVDHRQMLAEAVASGIEMFGRESGGDRSERE